MTKKQYKQELLQNINDFVILWSTHHNELPEEELQAKAQEMQLILFNLYKIGVGGHLGEDLTAFNEAKHGPMKPVKDKE